MHEGQFFLVGSQEKVDQLIEILGRLELLRGFEWPVDKARQE